MTKILGSDSGGTKGGYSRLSDRPVLKPTEHLKTERDQTRDHQEIPKGRRGNIKPRPTPEEMAAWRIRTKAGPPLQFDDQKVDTSQVTVMPHQKVNWHPEPLWKDALKDHLARRAQEDRSFLDRFKEIFTGGRTKYDREREKSAAKNWNVTKNQPGMSPGSVRSTRGD